MALEPLKIIKNWFRNSRTRENNWDEIRDKVVAWSQRVNNNLKQLGLDLDGSDYDFNNQGRKTQTIPIISRIETLEGEENKTTLSAKNISFVLDTAAGQIDIRSENGDDLSADNQITVTFNDTASAGSVIDRTVSANQSVTLTGAHWNFDGAGDQTDEKLWFGFADRGDGTDPSFIVAYQAGRTFITAADSETSPALVTSEEKVLSAETISGDNNVTWLGYFLADFDDTGNASGENHWDVQQAAGDFNIQPIQTYYEGEIRW